MKIGALTGSLTKTNAGNSYLTAGSNITITSASNGTITIDATGGAPGGSDTHVQYNSGGSFAGDSNFTYDGSTVYLTGSFSQGNTTFASGANSHAEGTNTTASGDYSHAEGEVTTASGYASHAEGTNVLASGYASHAEGETTEASGYASHVEGVSTIASGAYSHAEGSNTTALGIGSHTEGLGTIASGSYQHIGGKYNLRNNDFSLFVIGNGTGDDDIDRSDIVRVNPDSVQLTGSLIQSNNGSSTVGFMGNEVGSSPTSIGSDVFFYVSGSVGAEVASFGGDLVVSGTVSIGGDSLEVTGTISATQGFSGSLTRLVDGSSYLIAGNNIAITTASNGSVSVDAIPGGSNTEIQYNNSGVFTGSIDFTFNGSAVYLTGSLANGNLSVANGQYSHAEGYLTAVGSGGGYAHAEGESTAANAGWSHAEGYATTTNSSHSHAEGYQTTAGGQASHAEGRSTTTSGAGYNHAEGYGTTASGQYAHAEGLNTTASGDASHTEGTSVTAISNYSHAEGDATYSGYKGFNTMNITAGAVVINSSYGDVSSLFTAGLYSLLTWTSGQDQAYEISSASWDGTNTTVTLVDTSVNDVRPGLIGIRGSTLPTGADQTTSGIASHAEGGGTIAQPRYSHAEGYQSFAFAARSHAEGVNTTTLGVGSHSEGLGTIASGSYQHVGGKYNVRNNDFSLLVVGNGTSDLDVDRSDVLRVNSGSVGDGRVEVTGSLAATMGLSGSLTTLVDGTSYLIAGTNITITSASNGAITIDAAGGGGGGASYFDSTTAGAIFTSGSAAFVGDGDEWNVIDSPADKGTDVFFYVSGSQSSKDGATPGVALFGGDVVISGTLHGGSPLKIGSDLQITGSFSQGLENVASGLYSHAEGYETLAVGSYSHAEGGTGGGGQLIASGTYSHAEGYNTIAYASGSHAEGLSTSAGALGYKSTSISFGVITIDGTLYGNLSSSGLATITDGSFIILNDYGYDNNYTSAIYLVDTSTWDGTNTIVTLLDLTVSTTEAVIGVFGVANPTNADSPLGQFSHSEGYNTIARGLSSHAEGNGSIASNSFSHAEGEGTHTIGIGSHAEGAYTIASGSYSHAEGYSTIAHGSYSHSEGEATNAVGFASHTEGQGTIASGSYQHVGGKYNLRNNDFSLFVIGNGTGDDDVDRSDIFRVEQSSVQVSGSLIVSGAYILNVVSGTTAPAYTVNAWDHVIVFSANDVTATLPSSSPIGRKIIFKDGTGAASTAGGQMLSCSFGAIDGSATYTMASVNYTAVSVIKINDPDEWIVV